MSRTRTEILTAKQAKLFRIICKLAQSSNVMSLGLLAKKYGCTRQYVAQTLIELKNKNVVRVIKDKRRPYHQRQVVEVLK